MITSITVVASVWVAWFSPPTFEQRWSPAIEHPLHSVSVARTSFCYPTEIAPA
jgi:hypothetical protein